MATDELTMVFDAADFVSMNLVPAGVVKAEALIFLELNTASADAWFTSYNNTLAIVNSSVADSEYLVHFIGQSIEVFGIAPPSNPLFNTTFLVAGSIPIAYPAPGLEGQVYNGTQISILSDCYGLILDYALVTPGGTTNLEGSTIFLDDSNSEIKWDHNWNSTLHTTPATLSTGYPGDVFKGVFDWHRTPHNNSTHDSSIVGASFAFQFAGTSILISGVSPSTGSHSPGVLVMNFTLDGVTTTQHYFVRNISSFVDLEFHFPYFRNDTLPSGNHILTATIVDVIGNATASIDYITYRPNFALVAEKPIFPDLPSATGINGTASSPSATVPSPSVIHSPSATPSLTPNRPPKLHPIGAIVGGTIAGVVLVVVLWFGLWCRQKRKKLRSNENTETRSDSTFIEPFSPGTLTLPVYSTSRSKLPLQTVMSLPSPSNAAISPADDLHARSAHRSAGTERQSSDTELDMVITTGAVDNGHLEEGRIREIVAAEMSRLMEPPAYD